MINDVIIRPPVSEYKLFPGTGIWEISVRCELVDSGRVVGDSEVTQNLSRERQTTSEYSVIRECLQSVLKSPLAATNRRNRRHFYEKTVWLPFGPPYQAGEVGR